MMINYQSNLAIHSGEYLEEILGAINMDKAELANKIKEPKEMIEKLINGQIGIDDTIASRLEDVLKIPTHIWLGIESEYNSTKDKSSLGDEL